MYLDVKNSAQPCILLLPCEIAGHHLGTNLSQPRFLSEWFPGSRSLYQLSFWLLIFDQIEQILLPLLCCHLSVSLMVVCCTAHLQQWFCLLKFSMCCGGTVTELNTKELEYRCAVFRACISTTRFTDVSWHVKHQLHTEALQSHSTASGDGGRTKVKGCLC